MGTFQPAKQMTVGRAGRHYQTPDGRILPAVTTILGIVGKPALVNWAAKTEREMVVEAAAALWEDVPLGAKKMSRTAYVTTLHDRIGKTKAHQKELAKALEIGSQVHALIEWNLKKELGQKVGPAPGLSDKATWSFMVYEEWRKSAGLKPRAIEQTVWSVTHGYAGTMDVYGEVLIDGSPCVAVLDWKSGKAIYGEALLQNAAYVAALIEMGHAEPGCHGVIVRLPKVETDPEPEIRVITPDEHERHLAAFLAAKRLWEWEQARQAADLRPELAQSIDAIAAVPA